MVSAQFRVDPRQLQLHDPERGTAENGSAEHESAANDAANAITNYHAGTRYFYEDRLERKVYYLNNYVAPINGVTVRDVARMLLRWRCASI